MAEQGKRMKLFAPSYQTESPQKSIVITVSLALGWRVVGTQLIFARMNELNKPRCRNSFLHHLPTFFKVYWFREVRPWKGDGWLTP